MRISHRGLLIDFFVILRGYQLILDFKTELIVLIVPRSMYRGLDSNFTAGINDDPVVMEACSDPLYIEDSLLDSTSEYVSSFCWNQDSVSERS